MEADFDLRTLIYLLFFLWPLVSRLIQRKRQPQPEPSEADEWTFEEAGDDERPSAPARSAEPQDVEADESWISDLDHDDSQETWVEPSTERDMAFGAESAFEGQPYGTGAAVARSPESANPAVPAIEPGPFALVPGAASAVESDWGEADDEAWQLAIQAAKLRAAAAKRTWKVPRVRRAAKPEPRLMASRRIELRDAIVLNAALSPSRGRANRPFPGSR